MCVWVRVCFFVLLLTSVHTHIAPLCIFYLMSSPKKRKSRSATFHAIPVPVDTQIFSFEFRRSIVRSNGNVVDLSDLLELIFAPGYAARLLSTWKLKLGGDALAQRIRTHGGIFADRIQSNDMIYLKWLHPLRAESTTGRPRIACTPLGTTVVLNMIRSTRHNEGLDRALSYFESLVHTHDRINTLYTTESIIVEDQLTASVRKLLTLPPKHVVCHAATAPPAPLAVTAPLACRPGEVDSEDEADDNDDQLSIASTTRL